MRTPAMIEFLAALSVLALMLGLGTMTKATLGVALIATAVWFAVMQRVLQARRHHAACTVGRSRRFVDQADDIVQRRRAREVHVKRDAIAPRHAQVRIVRLIFAEARHICDRQRE